MWDIAYIAMLYTNASALLWQVEKTPQQILKELLENHPEHTATSLGEKLGWKYGYQGVFDILKGNKRFTPKLQERIAEILGVPKTHFQNTELTDKRNARIRDEFEAFLGTEIARRQRPDDIKLIERIGFAFIGDRLPTRAFFEVIALSLEGKYTTEQLSAALTENEGYDAER